MSQTIPLSIVLASFFQRLEAFEGIMRMVLSGARISTEMVFRGDPPKRVLLDFASSPARVLIDDQTHSGQIKMEIRSEIMHEIMLGRMIGGEAFARRELLIRGNATDLARFVPLFDFAPMLYREHLADLGFEGFRRPTGWAPMQEIVMNGKTYKGDPIVLQKLSRLETMMFKRINKAAYALGYMMGVTRNRFLKNLPLFDALESMSRGLEATNPKE